MITALGGGGSSGSSATILLGSTLSGNLLSAQSLQESYRGGRVLYTFFRGDSVSIPVSLQKDGRNFTIPETAVVRFVLISEGLNSIVFPAQTILSTSAGNNWQNSLVICPIPQTLSEGIPPDQYLSLEIEIADGSLTDTFKVSGLYIRKDAII